MNSTNQYDESINNLNRYAYFIFLIFAVTRPISLVHFQIPFFLDIFALGFSYLFLILMLISIRKMVIDRTGFLILIYLLLLVTSFAWGTEFREFAKLTLPIVFFFFTTTCISEKYKIDSFFICHVIGFLIPLILSTVFIILGLNIQMVEFLSKVPRHSGVYNGAHTLAYQMSFYSFIFCYNYSLFNI